MPAARKVVLTDQQRKELGVMIRASSTPQGLALRARMILRAAGLDRPANAVIGQELGCDRDTVGLWRNRFIELGIEGLQDAPRSGRPRSFSPR